ncbi:MAG: cytochrome C oxidase subunit IV family protein [Acidobacteriota bacterium]|jgi:cytochrome c oxidase subunit 4
MKPESVAVYARTWIALLALLAATCGSSFVPMGRFNVVLNFVIAGVKAALVALVFMHLRRDRPIVWLVAAAGFAWLSLLVGLSLADFLLRFG